MCTKGLFDVHRLAAGAGRSVCRAAHAEKFKIGVLAVPTAGERPGPGCAFCPHVPVDGTLDLWLGAEWAGFRLRCPLGLPLRLESRAAVGGSWNAIRNAGGKASGSDAAGREPEVLE